MITCLDFLHFELHAPALHAIDAPRRMIQKIGDAAQMTILPSSIANLRNVLTPGTKNDVMHERKQVIPLGLENSSLRVKMNLR